MTTTAPCRCGCGLLMAVAARDDERYGIVKGDPQYIRGHQNVKDWRLLIDIDPGTGCWNWIGNREAGYGRIGHRLVYRLAYEDMHGPVPVGFELDHLCRNRACVNPDHLEPVTRAVNVRRGLSTKLSTSQVAEIRQLFAAGATNGDIAERYGIGTTQASRIRRGESWRAA